MKKSWQISRSHKKTLDTLFNGLKDVRIKYVLDVGSGRTSLSYLTNRFKNVKVGAIVYPGDKRKIEPIKEYVKNKNYHLIETDLKTFRNNTKYDVILAHLFLGEAEKFGENDFQKILKKLFSIKTKYLILVNQFRDSINYNLVLKEISIKGTIIKIVYSISDSGEEYIAMLIRMK